MKPKRQRLNIYKVNVKHEGLLLLKKLRRSLEELIEQFAKQLVLLMHIILLYLSVEILSMIHGLFATISKTFI
jgi:hypothetical protein